MSHDGKRFTYVNQLASSDADLSERKDWFTCACCPPNMLRLLAQIGGYIWTRHIDEASKSAAVVTNLYVSSKLGFSVAGEEVEVNQQSDWPWHGEIKFATRSQSVKLTLSLRIPQWAESYTVQKASVSWCPVPADQDYCSSSLRALPRRWRMDT